jgi:hypothetical protein
MEGPNALLVLGLFILRIGVPLAITVGIGYVLTRLDAKWQAEADQQAQEQQAVQRKQSSLPASGFQVPVGKPAGLMATAGPPCWSLKGCTEAMKAQCAACHQPGTPCWMARTNAEGRLPAKCKGCELYKPETPMWLESDVIH